MNSIMSDVSNIEKIPIKKICEFDENDVSLQHQIHQNQ